MNFPLRSGAGGSLELTNALLENLSDPVVACDASGNQMHFNRAARAVHGLPDIPVPASEWARHYRLFHKDGVRPLAMEEVPLFRALSGETIHNVEIVVGAGDQRRIVLCNGQAVFDETGKKLGAVISMRDVTEMRKATAEQLRALSDSEKRFRTLFEQSPLSVQLLSVDGRTLQVNAAWKKLWGTKDDFVTNFILNGYNILQDQQLVEKGIMPYILEGFAGKGTKIPAIRYEPTEMVAIGRARWVEGFIEPILDEDGRVREVVLIHQDVSEIIHSEEQLRAARDAAEESNRLKSAFLANMSHEIRTPLGAVLGFSELLKDRNLSAEEANEYLEIMSRSGQALMRIIDDILDLSKIEAGRLQLELAPTDLNELLNEVAILFKVEVAKRKVQLVVEPVAETQANIETDATRLRQVLINLVGNAVKFTAQGEVRVTTEMVENELRISVHDTGIGISSELQTHLFQPFNQVDSSRTRRFGGTGLGLALSKRLAQALRGDIRLVSSQPQVGSVFQITLPYTPADSAKSAQNRSERADERTMKEVLDEIRILLVDDSEDNRKLLVRILAKRGAKVTEARDGSEAVSLASKGNFDIILMDVQMPVMDGNQATQVLRGMGLQTPIIALTAHAMAEERAKCIEAGANAHVTKPVQSATLTETILKLVQPQS